MNYFDPELQLKNTESGIENKLIYLLTELTGFKFVKTLVLEFKKIQSDDKTLYSAFYLNSKTEAIITESGIDDVFESIYSTIISNINIQKSLGQGSGWLIDSVLDHYINVSKYNTSADSSYIKLAKELNHPRLDLINIQRLD